jgi:pyruvate,orthophosphate dikinase
VYPNERRGVRDLKYVFGFDHRHDVDAGAVRALLGGKGANLGVMARDLELPVPPGFTISTDACRAYLSDGWPEGLDDEIREHMSRIEGAVSRRFGGPGEPLLVSVRSGAAVSMPGMMDTVLNLGLNDQTTAALAAVSGDTAFASACRERLEKMYRDIVGAGEVPADPWLQLRESIEAVFRSWNGDRAVSYRAHEGLPDDLGTGVNVQTMVFGNLGEDSATGVVFTRNPATGERALYGDVMFRAQGEEVVAGTATPEPITALDDQMPATAAELRRYSDLLERHYQDVCDIEFTIERGKLWMLQTRIGKRTPQAALRTAVEMAEDADFPLTRNEAVERVAEHLVDPPMVGGGSTDEIERVGTGIAASPGLASGVIATTPEAAVEMANKGQEVVLVRSETSPDDVHGMSRAIGILTAKGGLTSHAAVVARGWGIPAVVGAAGVQIDGRAVTIGDHAFPAGAMVTIDGASGEIFAGTVAITPTPTPEAALLLSWAEEFGIEIGTKDEEDLEVNAESTVAGDGRAVTTETVLRALLIKGFATPDLLAPAVVTTEEQLAGVLAAMAESGLVGDTAGMFSLSDEGKALGSELMEADRERWGVESANKALDDFLPLDRQMKEIVTAWQMREVDGEQVLNDHTDAGYDAGVLADFAALHGAAVAWLGPLGEGLPRLEDYSARLEQAARLTANGDPTYIASPRVDSYHSIWFELHEDLILLADRTREDEVAAGRA